MMNIAPDLHLVLPLLAFGGGTLLMAALEWRHRRHIGRLERALASQTEHLGAVERDLAAILSCTRRVGERIGAGERTQRSLQVQLDQLRLSDDNQVAVQHAMKLLSSGLDLKNVTAICDLSEGEVEILQNLARHQHAA